MHHRLGEDHKIHLFLMLLVSGLGFRLPSLHSVLNLVLAPTCHYNRVQTLHMEKISFFYYKTHQIIHYLRNIFGQTPEHKGHF